MEFSMKNFLSCTALGVVLVAAASTAHAQTNTVITAPAPTVVAQQPVETVETVRTVQTTTAPRRRIVRHPGDRVTTTRTTVSERMVPAPLYDVAAPGPMVGGPAVIPYRYVYEADRILVIDPYTNVAIQAIPR
jgi:hypothetical protein